MIGQKEQEKKTQWDKKADKKSKNQSIIETGLSFIQSEKIVENLNKEKFYKWKQWKF